MDKRNPLKLSKKERYILGLLTPPEKLSPSQMVDMDITRAKEEGKDRKLNRNTIYVIVGRMEKRGLLSGEHEEKVPGQEGRPRRLLSITPKGEYACALDDLGQAWDSPENLRKLQALVHQP